MANQSSCRSNRTGYSGNGRMMYGSGRPMSGYGRNTMGSARSMQDSARSVQDTDCSCREPDNSRSESRTMADTACPKRKDNSCSGNDSITCFTSTDFPIGMAYVPMQTWGPLYDPQKALCQGTLFPELDKPFLGGRAAR